MRLSVNSICLVVLTVLAALTALNFARDLLAPVVAAFVVGIVMTPLSDLWEKLRIPAAFAAILSVFLAIASLFVVALLLEPYVSKVISQGPIIRAELRETVDELRRVLRGLEQISEDMQAAIEPDAEGGGSGESEGESESVALPTVTDALFYAPQFLAQFLVFTGTLYFFLLARDNVYNWLSKTIPTVFEKDLRKAAKLVSRYVITISTINLVLGTVVAIAMSLIGMPSPIVWGILAFMLNFVLYLGPILLIAMLTVTGVVVFEGWMSFLPAATYILLNAIEAQFVTPTAVGRSLSVNPLMIFLSLIFWLWLWGPIGGIIAIPLLIWTMTIFKGFGDHAISGGTPGKF